jgi:putative membrane protein
LAIHHNILYCEILRIVLVILLTLVAWLQMPWMHVKLGFVFALYLYHGKCQQIFNQLQTKLNTQPILCAYGTRVLLILLVVVLVIKNAVNWFYYYWNL